MFQAYDLLKPGGYFFAEDFFELGTLTENEKQTLKRDVFCSYLPKFDLYQEQLKKAGFELVKVCVASSSLSFISVSNQIDPVMIGRGCDRRLEEIHAGARR